jgi:hypothetical protein
MSGIGPNPAAPLQSLSHFRDGFIPGIGLGEEGHVEGFEPVLDQHLCRVGRHIEDTLVGPLLQDLLRELDPVTFRHDDVDDQQVDASPRLTQRIQGLGTRLCLQHTVTLFGENAVGDAARHPFIIYDEDGGRRTGEWN